MAEIPSIFLEEECQAACAAFSSCVSYTWASERAGELGIEPYLCQLFTSCHKSYDALQQVSSGTYIIMIANKGSLQGGRGGIFIT